MQVIQDRSEHDLAQYYRGTYVVLLEGKQVLRVQDVEGSRLIFDDCSADAQECAVYFPEIGYYNGVLLRSFSDKHYKKGMLLNPKQAIALRRYLLTGQGYSPFYSTPEGWIKYKDTVVGVHKNYVVIPDERLAEKYRQEYRVPAYTSIESIQAEQEEQ